MSSTELSSDKILFSALSGSLLAALPVEMVCVHMEGYPPKQQNERIWIEIGIRHS